MQNDSAPKATVSQILWFSVAIVTTSEKIRQNKYRTHLSLIDNLHKLIQLYPAATEYAIVENSNRGCPMTTALSDERVREQTERLSQSL